jgi:hypothetical protein
MDAGQCGRASGAPDRLTEEIASMLWPGDWIGFGILYSAVEARIEPVRSLAEAPGQLRRETFDRLQLLVRQGFVENRGEFYRGVCSRLAALRDRFAAQHCRTLLRAIDTAPTH